MSSISLLRDGLAANLATISGLRAADTVPDNPNPPIAVVIPDGIEYRTAFNSTLSRYSFIVLVIVGRADERTAQDRLDAYCSTTGTSSVPAALESNTALGGEAFDLEVTEMRNYRQLALSDGITYLAAEFVVSVIAE